MKFGRKYLWNQEKKEIIASKEKILVHRRKEGTYSKLKVLLYFIVNHKKYEDNMKTIIGRQLLTVTVEWLSVNS